MPLTGDAGTCHTPIYHEVGQIAHIIDGDTVVLTDDRHVRLVGINTPEIDHKDLQHETGALEARKFLVSLTGRHSFIYLYYDAETEDRYQRVLAHLFLPDGINIQAEILRRGMAVPLTLPPNLAFLDCYQSAAQQARSNDQGLWKLPAYQVIPVTEIQPAHIGHFVQVSGTVMSTKRTTASLWINLGRELSLRLKSTHLHYFDSGIEHQLIGKDIIAKGKLNKYKNRYSINIHHPVDLILKFE